MARTNKVYQNFSKKNLLPYLITAPITSIVERKMYDNSFKLVFECQVTQEKTLRCIYWANPNVDIGDTVRFKGWFSKDVFIVESLQIAKKTEETGAG